MSQLTTADVVLGLDYRVDGRRHSRDIEVIKHRGQAPLSGLHPYTITAQVGHTVFPRLEARPLPPTQPRLSARAGFGLPELDVLLGGGLNSRTTTVVAGAPGAGKTTLALHWALAEAQPERHTVFFSFAEHEEELREKARAFSMDLEPALASGALILIRMSPSEMVPDIVATQLLDVLTETTERLVIDDISGLVRALGARAPDYLAALNEQLYARSMTSLVLYEIDAFTGFGFDLARTPLALVAHNVLVMQQVTVDGVLRRMLAVLKMRFSAYDRTIRELVLDPRGVRVLSIAETPGKPTPPT
jgi:circadian clock protein KaiC